MFLESRENQTFLLAQCATDERWIIHHSPRIVTRYTQSKGNADKDRANNVKIQAVIKQQTANKQ